MTAPLRNYEIGIIFHPQTPKEDIDALRDRIVNGIPRLSSGVGQVFKVDEWGIRRLAYTIRKQNEGYYLYLYAHMPSDLVHEVERLLNLTEAVMRYLVIQADPPADEPAPPQDLEVPVEIDYDDLAPNNDESDVDASDDTEEE